MRTVGQTLGRMRRMATEFQGQFMEAMREVEREADLDSVKKEFQAISDQATAFHNQFVNALQNGATDYP